MSSKKQIRICPACNQKIVQYKHCLNKTLINNLSKLYHSGGKSRLDGMNLSHSEFTNFQKLRYFGLAYNNRDTNEWILTGKGKAFLGGKETASKFVITENANVVEFSEEKVFISQIKDCVQYKIDWQEQAAEKEPSLFDLLEDGQKNDPITN